MSITTWERPALWNEIRALLFAAMAVFVYTIGIGILNGTDLVDFDIKRILGHVHGGTLGWLTMAVFAAAFWLFGEGTALSPTQARLARWITLAAIISFPLYVLAFTFTTDDLRPLAGVLALAVIFVMFLWLLWRLPGLELSVPHWGFLAAMASSVVGGAIGVLWGFEIATDADLLPDGGEDSHPAMMVVGFLIPVGLAMAEWAFFFPHPNRATRAGVIQMAFPFVGGVVLMVALLVDVDPLAAVSILLEVIGIIIFLVRMWPSFRGVAWTTAGPGRYAVLSAAGALFVIGLAQYFVIKYEADFDLVPDHQILALDHAQFIGAMTNAVFAMLLATTLSNRRWPRLDHLVFLAVNAGIVVFVIGLLGDWTVPKRIATPIMGGGLLLGLATFALALYEGRSPGPAR